MILRDRLKVGRLTLNQVIGVRIPVPQHLENQIEFLRFRFSSALIVASELFVLMTGIRRVSERANAKSETEARNPGSEGGAKATGEEESLPTGRQACPAAILR